MKKVLAIFTLVSFLFYITSCYSYKTLTSQEEYSKYANNKWIHVRFVKTKQGNILEFHQFYPGRISETGVDGLPQLRLLPGEQDSSIFINYELKAIWKNGINYELIKQDTLGYICHASDTIKIPFSDIEQLSFQKFEIGATLGIVSGIAFTIFLIYGVIVSSQIGID